MKMKNVGVNGFGRIGRYFTRLALLDSAINVAMVNDPADTKTLIHLLKYDSIHRIFPLEFTIEGDVVTFENGKKIIFSHEKNPELIAWGQNNVEIIVESSGLFLTREAASKHLIGGAKKVIISAPASDADIPAVVLGVNEEVLELNDNIISNASCTTNNVAPMIAVMRSLFQIDYAYISTVHSYTSDQRLHDAPHKDLRRARAAANSIVPTSTGAAKAVIKIFPEYKGKMTGGSVRVPVADGSMTELTMFTETPVTVEEINAAMKLASETNLKGILGYTEDPIVSVDIIGSPLSCLFDAQLTTVLGKLVKISGWYDNETGYSNRLVDLVKKL
jgi:glyceraldehyde 3-phosphate dehydrogenase